MTRLLPSVFGLLFTTCVTAGDPPPIEIEMFAGVALSGNAETAGGWYAIEASSDLSAWKVVDAVQLKVGPNYWVDSAFPAEGHRFYRATEISSPIVPAVDMVHINAGVFLMGSPESEAGRSPNEGPQTLVTLTKGFFMSRYEITEKQYRDVIGYSPTGSTRSNYPIYNITFQHALAYCAALTVFERNAGRIPSSYRLPTEAEWEYACRAGTTTAYSFGDSPAELTNYAWYIANSNPGGGVQLAAVGQKLPNPWGLYDMHGNAPEWVADFWNGSAMYSGGSVEDPLGTSGAQRIQRGGGSGFSDTACRSAYRYSQSQSAQHATIRLVLAPN